MAGMNNRALADATLNPKLKFSAAAFEQGQVHNSIMEQ